MSKILDWIKNKIFKKKILLDDKSKIDLPQEEAKGYSGYTLEELQDVNIKDNIIKDIIELHEFLVNATPEEFNALFDANGIDILIGFNDKESIECVLNYEKESDLYKNINFCKKISTCEDTTYRVRTIIDENIYDYIKTLMIIESKEKRNDLVVNYYKSLKICEDNKFQMDKDTIQGKIVREFNFDKEKFKNLLIYSNSEALDIILQKCPNMDLSSLSDNDIIRIVRDCVKIPDAFFTKDIIEKIANNPWIMEYRKIMQKLLADGSISKEKYNLIEQQRKKYYENYLENYQTGEIQNEKANDIMLDYLYRTNLKVLKNDFTQIADFIANDPNYSQQLKDKYKNVVELLIKNKCDFSQQYEFFKSISADNNLAEYKEIYNDCYKKMVEDFNRNLLNKEKLNQFKDELASKENGVNIYYLNGQEFYTLVRCETDRKKSEDNYATIDSLNSDYSSFSIDSPKTLKLIKDPREYYTIMYDRIPANQLKRVFSFDACTEHGQSDGGPLGLPFIGDIKELTEETTKSSDQYNEILIETKDENNENKTNIVNPKPIAIYCYDNYNYKDIELAKREGVGIVCVNTKAYDKQKNKEEEINKKENKYSNFELNTKHTEEREL